MRQERLHVQAKVAAIKAQSPDLPDDLVSKTAEREVSDGREIWGAINFAVHWYSVEGPSPEHLGKWKNEVEQLLSDLEAGVASHDLSSFIQASEGTATADDIWDMVQDIKSQAQEEGLQVSPEAKQLLAINLWIKRKQGVTWKKETLRRTVWKIITGEGVKIAEVLNRDAAPNCIDIAYLIKAMGHQFGIQGEVKQIPSSTRGINHRYFQTESGTVSDYWWLRKSGGLALSTKAYQKLLAKRAAGHHRHTSKQEQ